MPKKHVLKFWIFFWLISAIFLSGWFLYWNIRNRGASSTVEDIMKILPIDAQQKKDYQALAAIGEYLLRGGKEKTFLVLFQNNLEIRPGGGFLGAFAIVKIKNGKIISMQTHDLSNFDVNIPNIIPAPYPIGEIMGTNFWKMRDSNFSPDFEVDGKNTQEFYRLGGGREKIDGVIGVTSDVLSSVLKVTGPISVDGYPGTYDSNNAIISLEYQVEKAFGQQGIARGDRKSIMGDLAKEIEQRVYKLSTLQKIKLAKILLEDLEQKNIQLQFNDPVLEQIATAANWTGKIDQQWRGDYLMTVDANLGSFKSDYYIKRSIDYSVDLSGSEPLGHLKITYQHTATQKDWMTRDYLTYLRVYVPQGSKLLNSENFDDIKTDEEFGKQYFGALVRVPLATTKTVEISYTLPIASEQDYDLLVQKQAGLNNIPMNIHIVRTNGNKDDFSISLNRDFRFEENIKAQ